MIRALYTAASGMQGQQKVIDTTANNLANVNTAGFKKNRVEFQDLFYQAERSPGSYTSQNSQMPTGIEIGLGTRAASTSKIHLQGNLIMTGNPLDLAVEGQGFFQIQSPDGDLLYTRDGAFKVDQNGQVVNNEGYFLDPNITIPQDVTTINVGTDGTVSAQILNQPATQNIGQITIAKFINPAGLLAVGSNMYRETDASGTPIVGNPGQNSLGTIRQGTLEASNVQVVEEMINLIVGQRAYEASSKAIQTSDQMLGVANGLSR